MGSDHFSVFYQVTCVKKLVHNLAVVHNEHNVKKADWEVFEAETSEVDVEECIERVISKQQELKKT